MDGVRFLLKMLLALIPLVLTVLFLIFEFRYVISD